jgi:hypothetical protein
MSKQTAEQIVAKIRETECKGDTYGPGERWVKSNGESAALITAHVAQVTEEKTEAKIKFLVDALFAMYELIPEGSIKEQCSEMIAPYEALDSKADAKGETP